MPIEPMIFDIESDEWSRAHDQDGRVRVAFRSFHLCMSGAGGPFGACCTGLVASNIRMAPGGMLDMITRGEQWFCGVCGARYRPGFGLLNEIWYGGYLYWMRSEMPLMHSDLPSAELEQMIELIHPHITEDDMIRRPRVGEIWHGPEEGVVRIVDPEAFCDMRVWKWTDLIAFVQHF